MTTKYLLIAIFIAALTGCADIPQDAFFLAESSLEDRQLQSREFPTGNEAALLAASAEILRNMGYATEIDSNLGLITAHKNEDSAGASALLVTVLSIGVASTEKGAINATFVATPLQNTKDAYITRITFHRIALKSNGEMSDAELLKDQKLYDIFYERLGESLFIEPRML